MDLVSLLEKSFQKLRPPATQPPFLLFNEVVVTQTRVLLIVLFL